MQHEDTVASTCMHTDWLANCVHANPYSYMHTRQFIATKIFLYVIIYMHHYLLAICVTKCFTCVKFNGYNLHSFTICVTIRLLLLFTIIRYVI